MSLVARCTALLSICLALAIAPARAGTRFECELFGAVLEDQHAGAGGPALYVSAQTSTDMVAGTYEQFKARLPGVTEELFRSFTDNNKLPAAVDCAGVRPAGRDVVVSDKPPTNRESRWVLSRAGVDAAGSRALLYTGYGCGPLCGAGTLYLLERKAGKWSVKSQTMVWIS